MVLTASARAARSPQTGDADSQRPATERPIRIAHCIHGVGLGGAQQVVKGLVEKSDPDEFSNTVYCSVDGVRRAEIERAGARVHVMRRRLPKFDPWWVRALANQMATDRIDLVHTHLFGDSLHGYLAARKHRRPVVMTLHSLTETCSRVQRLGYRWLIARSARVVACSGLARDSWRRIAGAGGTRIGCIPNGVPAPRLVLSEAEARGRLSRDLQVPEDALLVAAIGRLVPDKAHDRLLHAFAGLDEAVLSRSRLLLIGEGPLESDLRRLTERLDLTRFVRFAGLRVDVPELLPAIDVVAFSSRFEGLPIALLEAMEAGRAIVSTAVGGIPEAVRHRQEALLVPPGDSRALCSEIGRLANDSSLRAALGRQARHRFHERYTVELMAEAYQKLYRDLHEHRRTTGRPEDDP